jgi:regulatory protein
MEELYEKLMHYSLGLLGRRAYTVKGLQDKLKIRVNRFSEAAEYHDQAILKVTERLSELKYLDDLSFAERFIAERTRLKPRGRYGLNQELRKKGISRDVLDKFWDSPAGQEFDELPLASELLEKRSSRLKTRQKMYQFLASRGFSVSTVRSVLDKKQIPY